MRVACRFDAVERQGAGAGRHAVAGCDVVLDHNRHAMQWSAQRPGRALGVERSGNLQRVRIEFDDAAQLGTLPVERGDPLQIVTAGAHGAGWVRSCGGGVGACHVRRQGRCISRGDCGGKQTK
jgi:hypothetical protein